MTIKGDFHRQCTDIQGGYKNAEFLKQDLKIAVDEIGIKNVFVIVLDGACKRTIRMINEVRTVDGEDKVLARIFGVRCSLHGASFYEDISPLLWKAVKEYFE